MATLNIPEGFASVDDYVNNLRANMEATHPFDDSTNASEDLPATTADQDDDQVQDALPADDDDQVRDTDAPAKDEADEVMSEPVDDNQVHDIIYERDLRSNNKRDIDFTNVPVGAKVHVFANRHSGGYSYLVEASYEATLANKKIAQRHARILMRDRSKEVHAEEDEDLALLTEISALRRMQSRTKKVNILVALAEGHTRALEIYEAQQLLDNERVKLSNERLSRVYQFNERLADDQDYAIKNARYNVLKPCVGKRKKRSAQTKNNAPY